MAARIADRLTTQEEQIRGLSDEIGRLLELGLQGTIECEPSPALQQLRAENEKLKYRIAHLQRSLKEEQGKERPGLGRPEESPGLERPEERPGLEESPGLERPEESPEHGTERPRDKEAPPEQATQAASAAGDTGENPVSENHSAPQNNTKKGKKVGNGDDGLKSQPIEQI